MPFPTAQQVIKLAGLFSTLSLQPYKYQKIAIPVPRTIALVIGQLTDVLFYHGLKTFGKHVTASGAVNQLNILLKLSNCVIAVVL